MTPEQERQLQELLDFKKSLEMSSRIPLAVDQAFRERFKNLATTIQTQSTKGADSEDVTVVNSVNFGAQTVGTTAVLNDPSVFLGVVIDGVTYYLAAWTS